MLLTHVHVAPSGLDVGVAHGVMHSDPIVRREGRLFVTLGQPGPRALAAASCWHEYRYPEQLEEMALMGATSEWIAQDVLKRLEDFTVWFASADGALDPSEIMVCAAKLDLAEIAKTAGYLTIVEGEVASATCLEWGEVLSTAEILDEENAAALGRIARAVGHLPGSLLPVRYSLPGPCCGIALRGEVQVVVSTRALEQ